MLPNYIALCSICKQCDGNVLKPMSFEVFSKFLHVVFWQIFSLENVQFLNCLKFINWPEVQEGSLMSISVYYLLQNRGKRLKEGAHINRSLLALGNVINALGTIHILRNHNLGLFWPPLPLFKGAFTNYVYIFWQLTMYVSPLVFTFYVVNQAFFWPPTHT